MTLTQLALTALLLLTGGIANMTAVAVGTRGWLRPLAKPVNERLFGASKTWRGYIVGVSASTVFYNTIALAIHIPTPLNHWWVGTLVGVATMLGDTLKSGVKRRLRTPGGALRYPAGSKWWLDRYDACYGFLAALPFAAMPLESALLLVAVAVISVGILHSVVVHIAYRLHLKGTPY